MCQGKEQEKKKLRGGKSGYALILTVCLPRSSQELRALHAVSQGVGRSRWVSLIPILQRTKLRVREMTRLTQSPGLASVSARWPFP